MKERSFKNAHLWDIMITFGGNYDLHINYKHRLKNQLDRELGKDRRTILYLDYELLWNKIYQVFKIFT